MKFLRRLNELRRASPVHVLADTVVIMASVYASLWLRLGFDWGDFKYTLSFALPMVMTVRLASLYGFSCYKVMWRYISLHDAMNLAKAIAFSTALIVAITFFVPPELLRLPRSVYLIDAVLATLGLMGLRLLRRAHYENHGQSHAQEGQRTLIYGAGRNGRLLADRFKDQTLGIKLVGFIDDDPQKQSINIGGVSVLGTREDLKDILEKQRIAQLIVAIPTLSGGALREIVEATRPYNIRPRITPNLINQRSNRPVEITRDIQLSDLLNRSARNPDLTAVRQLIQGKCVLVTGAGGSIGSELARQILSHEPSRLLILDHSEYNLYEIDNELRVSTHDTQRVVPLMIDLKDEASVRAALKEFMPEVVFHAAAYKHVHLVENNPYTSIINNVFTTKALLEACREIDVKTFVMISTDKAVNPVGIMGSTKRACELLVTSAAIETGHRYCSVRFGNVLGSSGSLIPLLQKQIRDGGPITVTHPDMTRFFMLIPEAVSLVLTAATIAKPGDINVLKMGEPVRILDVAKNLLALMGKSETEIPIIFTGLRPGEKMFEELYIRGDELKTEHDDILTLPNGDSLLAANPEERKRLMTAIGRMLTAARQGTKEAIYELNSIVKTSSVTMPAAAAGDTRTTPHN